jgi:hypothetical protein
VHWKEPCSSDVRKRFLAKVDRTDGCWLWLAARRKPTADILPYGQFKYKGQMRPAHRVSYELFVGDPAGLDVLHKCDTPSCVRPDHLELGDDSKNQLDALARERRKRPVGEANPNCLLTTETVLKIRERSLQEHICDIARDYGLLPSHVQKIVQRVIWRHI